ncbi:hypothetical protein K8I28_02735 [bacterium]|nr:hypothetical protein [bacterium]
MFKYHAGYRFWVILILLSMVTVHAGRCEQWLQHSIGDTITLEEAQTYGLFEDEEDFFVLMVSSGLKSDIAILNIQYTEESQKPTENIVIHASTINLIDEWLHWKNQQLNSAELKPLHAELELPEKDFTGDLLQWKGRSFVLGTTYGNLEIPVQKVKKHYLEHQYRGYFRGEDPNRTRLFFAPTGWSLPKGDGYSSVYEVVLPGFQYGITDRFSIGGGIFPFSSEQFAMAWITPKFGIVENEKGAFSLGIFSTFVHFNNGEDPGQENEDSSNSDDIQDANFGILYGVGTIKNERNAYTGGLGFGYANGNLSSSPMVVIGWEYEVRRGFKLLSENWILPGLDQPILSFGGRWYGKRLAADFALIRTFDMQFLGVPWVDFVVNF